MKKIKKIKDVNKHLKMFILMTTLVFVVFGILHFSLIAYDLDIYIGNVLTPWVSLYSYLVAFISLCMAIMGRYYYKVIDSE